MTPFTQLSSAMIPLLAANIDTDQIIPAQYVNVQGQAALADALFANLRRDPAFVLNQPGMAGRRIVLAGRNFGCGSSREAAAWALGAAGIRALIGVSFNTTFWTNCVNNAILPVTLDEQAYAALCDAAHRTPALSVTIDLAQRSVSAHPDSPAHAGAGAGPMTFSFAIEAFARELLLTGQDELGYLLQRRGLIAAYRQHRAGAAA